jgi:chaperonin cofactor prefoldin
MKRQLEALRAENEALKAARAAGEADGAADAAPKFEAFAGDYEAFETARIEWAARKTVREQQRVLDTQRERAVETEVQAEVLREFQSQQNEARKALKDFDQVLAKGTAPVARHVGELVIESDKAALLQYHLAQRPDLVAELNSLSPRDAARRIGRLEARLSLPTPKTATKAPPPPKTEPRGGATPRNHDADLDAWLTKQYGKKS